VLADCIDLLQSAIDDKAPKLQGYLEHCDECWLLLVADSMKPSATIHPGAETLARTFISPFDRTFFLNFGMGTVSPLKTR
jgi:hypothetical protein